MEEDDIPTFAAKIKAKYPDYADLDDTDLVERVVRKHPVYAKSVKLPSEFRLLSDTTGYSKLDDIYEQAGREHGVDPNLLLNQGRQETINFKPSVMYGRQDSPKGARGAGQFMPGTAPVYGLTVNDQQDDRTDPIKSINAQAKYMRKLLDQFDGDESLALAGYNAGEHRPSLKAGKVPNIKETQEYVKIITKNLNKARAKHKPLSSYLQNIPTQPVTEPVDTIKAQIQSALDPRQMDRSAVLITDPSQADFVANDMRFDPVQTKEGILYVNKEKARKLKLRTQKDIQQFVDKNADALTRLTGRVLNVGNNTAEGMALRTEQGGKELSTSIVDPNTVQAQAASDQRQFPQADNQELLPAQDAVAKRIAEANAGGAPTRFITPEALANVPEANQEDWVQVTNSAPFLNQDGQPWTPPQDMGPRSISTFEDLKFSAPTPTKQSLMAVRKHQNTPEGYQDWLEYTNKKPSAEALKEYKDAVANAPQGSVNADVAIDDSRASIVPNNWSVSNRDMSDDDILNNSETIQVNLQGIPQKDKTATLMRQAISAVGKKYGASPERIEEYLLAHPTPDQGEVTSEAADQVEITVGRNAIAELVGRDAVLTKSREEQQNHLLDAYIQQRDAPKSADKIPAYENPIEGYYRANSVDGRLYSDDDPLLQQARENVQKSPFMGRDYDNDVQEEYQRLKTWTLSPEERSEVLSPDRRARASDAGVLSSLLASISGGTGRSVTALAGLTRFVGIPGMVPESWSAALSKTGQRMQLMAEGEAEDQPGIVNKGIRLVGGLAGDTPRFVLLSRLPGGMVGMFATDHGLQAVGKGERTENVAKEVAAGAVTGAIFKGASKFARAVEAGTLQRTLPGVQVGSKTILESRDAQRALATTFGIGAKLGTIAVGTATQTKAQGGSTGEALEAGLTNALLALAMEHPGDIAKGINALQGKIFRGKMGEQAKTVTIEPDGSIVELKKEVPSDLVDAEIALKKVSDPATPPTQKNPSLQIRKDVGAFGTQPKEIKTESPSEANVSTKEGRPAVQKLPELTDNSRKPLSTYTPRLYRETNAKQALDLLLHDNADSAPYFSNTPNLAKGQGSNKGVMVELKSDGLQGQVNKKPGYEFAYKNGEAEFVGQFNPSYSKNIEKVTITPDAFNQKSAAILRNTLEKQGFQKEILDDGSIVLTRPAQSVPFSKNKIITADKVDAARELLRKKNLQFNSGIDPEAFKALATIGAAHIEAGARNFAAFSKAMIDDLGKRIEPHLDKIYSEVKTEHSFPEMEQPPSVLKMRSLPKTLREADLAARDEAYKVWGDKEAVEGANRVLKDEGLEGSIKYLERAKTFDKEDAVLSVKSQRLLLDEAQKASERGDTEYAAELRGRSLELAAKHARLATEAGQFNQAAAMLAQTADGVLYTANKRAAERKRPLSSSEYSNFERLGTIGEEQFNDISRYQNEIGELKKRIAELESGRSVPRERISQRVTARAKEKLPNLEELRKTIREQMKTTLPKEAGAVVFHRNLEKTTPELVKSGATYLIDQPLSKISREQFYRDMTRAFGKQIEDILPQLFGESINLRGKLLKESRVELAAERLKDKFPDLSDEQLKDKQAEIDNERLKRTEQAAWNKRLAGMYAPEVAKRVGDTIRIVHEIADLPEAASYAERLLTKTTTPKDLQRSNKDVYQEAQRLIGEAKLQLQNEKQDVREQLLTDKSNLKLIEREEFLKRRATQQTAADLARAFRRLEEHPVKYYGKEALKLLGESRSILASGDLSGSLRQGFYYTVTNPLKMFKGVKVDGATDLPSAFGGMVKGFVKNKHADNMVKIENHPNFDTMQKMGIEFAEAGASFGKLTSAEENIRTDYAKKIPVLNKWLDISERTYSGFLDAQRALIGDQVIKELQSQDITFKNNPEAYKAAGKLINIATGRGDFTSNKTLNDAVNSFGRVLFAPRYAASRFQLLKHVLGGAAATSAGLRAAEVKRAMRFHAVVTLPLMAGVASGLVSIDPDDDDFLKWRIGSKARYEGTGGLQGYVRYLAQMGKAIVTNGADGGKPLSGKLIDQNVNFWSKKLAPIPSYAYAAAKGKEADTSEFNWWKGITNRLTPISVREFAGNTYDDGVLGFLATSPSIFGIGVGYYPDKEAQNAKEKKQEAAKQRKKNPWTP